MQDPTVPPPSDQAATEGPLTEFIRRFTEFLPERPLVVPAYDSWCES